MTCMIWATISSKSCFPLLYRASPSSAAKNIIDLILALSIWWWTCVVFSCTAGKGPLLWPVCFLTKLLLPFALLHFIFQGQTSLLFHVSLDFLLGWKEYIYIYGVSSRRSSRLSYSQLQLLWNHSLGDRLGLLWSWMAYLGNSFGYTWLPWIYVEMVL